MDTALHLLAGILLGGLVNALADNLPQGRMLARPRYSNGAARPPVAWLGLSAFLFDRRLPPGEGKPGDGQKLSWRYPLVELALAGLLLAADRAAAESAQAALGQQALWQAYVCVFVLLTIVDIEHKRILLPPILAASLLALIDAAAFPQHPPGLPSSLAGGVVGGGVFWLAYAGGQVYGRIRGRRRALPTAFGTGDIYVMAMGGLLVGFPDVLAAIVLAVCLGGAGALAYLLGARRRGEREGRFAALPYAPYILAATYFVMLFPGAISLPI